MEASSTYGREFKRSESSMGQFDDYNFVTPSFLRGVGQALDLGGCLGGQSFQRQLTSEEADLEALASDWRVVGRDLNEALARITSALPGS
jgi:hypothetical protein